MSDGGIRIMSICTRTDIYPPTPHRHTHTEDYTKNPQKVHTDVHSHKYPNIDTHVHALTNKDAHELP